MKRNVLNRIFKIIDLREYDLTACPFMIGWRTWDGKWLAFPVSEVEKNEHLRFIYFKNNYKSLPFMVAQKIWMAF